MLVREDGQRVQRPALVLLVDVFGRLELYQVTDREGHDQVIALPEAIVLLEPPQGRNDVARNARLLRDHQGFCQHSSSVRSVLNSPARPRWQAGTLLTRHFARLACLLPDSIAAARATRGPTARSPGPRARGRVNYRTPAASASIAARSCFRFERGRMRRTAEEGHGAALLSSTHRHSPGALSAAPARDLARNRET